jgi:phytoene dehydrogenase-like protein
MADYDAIVVGSGHNALVCALYLARAGMRIAVFERSATIGGALRSAEFTRPGFIHDLFATNVGQFAVSPAYRDFAADFDRAGLRFLSGEHPYASAFAGGKALRVYKDRDRTEREIAALSSADAAAWRGLVGLFVRTAPRFLPLFFTPMPSAAAAALGARLLTRAPRDALRLARILRATPLELVARFRSAAVRDLLVPWAFHMDSGPDTAGGATFAFVAGMSGHLRGLSVAAGGAGEISRALGDIARSLGVDIRTSAEVTAVRVEHGRATGVSLAGGETVTAPRVIASVTPKRLFGGLVADEHLPPRFRLKARGFRYGPATFVVHLALDRPLEWRAAEDLARFNYVHVCGSTEEIARTYADSLSGMLPERPMLVVSQTTPVDPSRAPPGKHVARIHVRTVPAEIAGDAAGRIRGRDWREAAAPYAERLLDLVAEHAPNIRQALLATRIVAPPEIEADNPNLVGGDCVSGSHHLDQNFVNRPFRGWSRYATPVRGLYMVGASTWPGGGVHGGSGYLLARRLLA